MSTVNDLVHDLIEHLKEGKILDAFEKHYAEHVEMAESRGEPTVGKDANREREKQFLASVKEWKGLSITALGVSPEGNDSGTGVSFLEYDFDFINQDDEPIRYEQVAVQTWENGKIVREKFYYDPGA